MKHEHESGHGGHGHGGAGGHHRHEAVLCIEGKELPWHEDTITTEQIAALGGWDVSQGVIEVDRDNNERTLAPGEVIEVTPGRSFGKKHCWKRG